MTGLSYEYSTIWHDPWNGKFLNCTRIDDHIEDLQIWIELGKHIFRIIHSMQVLNVDLSISNEFQIAFLWKHQKCKN